LLFLVAVDLDCAAPSPHGVYSALARMTPPWLRRGPTRRSSGSEAVAAQPILRPVPDEELTQLPPNSTYAWDSWDVLTAAPHPGDDYYDLSALRAPGLGAHFAFDCWYDMRGVLEYGNCMEHRLTLSAHAPIVPVESAFNGAAIYRLAAVNRSGCGYIPYYRELPGSAVQPVVVHGACEHVSFHVCLRARGLAIGIDPSLETGCWRGWHTKRASPLVRVHVAANGSVLRRLNPLAPKSTTRVSKRMHDAWLHRAATDVADAKERANRAWRLWHQEDVEDNHTGTWS